MAKESEVITKIDNKFLASLSSYFLYKNLNKSSNSSSCNTIERPL